MILGQRVRSTHTYVIGATGAGKSRAMETWILQDARRGRGFGVIDPAGDLFSHSLSRLAILLAGKPDLLERVVIVNPLDPQWMVGFNPLEILPGEVPERKAKFLADVITKVWRADPLIVTRMRRLMYHTFLALMGLGLTLLELPDFLVDEDFRGPLLANLEDKELERYWAKEFPKSFRDRTVWMQSTLNRLGDLVTDPDIRLMVGQLKSTINFRETMDRGLILLVNTPKGILGEQNTYLLDAFFLAQIQQAAMSRADMPESRRNPFYLYLDEFQNYTTEGIHEILAESRKYGLSLIVAHQFLGQLRDVPVLKEAILNTVGNTVCFQVGPEDAAELAPIIFNPDLNTVKDRQLQFHNLGGVPIPHFRKTYRPLLEVREALSQKLKELDPRYFWYKRRGVGKPRHFRSLDASDPILCEADQERLRQLIEMAGRKYARLKGEVKRELAEERPRLIERLMDNARNDVTDYE